MYRRGFTLIEALAVVAIIGTLLLVSGYMFSQASRQARDARRKTDLTSISLGFEARFQDKTCNTGVGLYPGGGFKNSDVGGVAHQWAAVKELRSYTDGCGPFTDYLRLFPTDPRYESTHPYVFNLPDRNKLPATHYRLAARLEKKLTSQESADRSRILYTWTGTFGGANNLPDQYTYIIGN